MVNPLDALKLTDRIVSTVEINGRVARRSQLARTYRTSAEDLWDALTNPERIPRWFLPVTGDFRVGGSYQLEGNAGGVIEHCDPPNQLRLTWIMFPDAPPTWLTLTLTPAGDGTRLEVDHVGEVPEELWAQFGPGATGIGWDLAVRGLGEHIDSGEPADPADAAAWAASPEGLEFMTGSNTAWMQAAIASGMPREEAAECAERTLAVYTGQAEPPSM